MYENTSTPITLSGIDFDGDELTYVIMREPRNGTLSGSAPDLTYTPDSDFTGSDYFLYYVNDGKQDSEPAAVEITVRSSNNPPEVYPSTVSLKKNSSVTITLSASDPDGDTLTYAIHHPPMHGRLVVDIPYLTYIPDQDYVGEDAFVFKVSDGKDTSMAGIDITVEDDTTAYVCPASTKTERDFTDDYVANAVADRAWSVPLTAPVTVDQIAAEFNAARALDPTIDHVSLVMPSQEEWDSYTDSQKALYLINSERCARGIRPFEGIDTDIVVAPAQKYADYLKEHNAWGHTADGRSPFDRLKEDGGVLVGTNADFFSYGENLAYVIFGNTAEYPVVHEPVAMAVYSWLYDDKNATGGSYGHRKFLLATGLRENFGKENVEGLIGVGVSMLRYEENGFKITKVYTVLNGFDPNENWHNGSNIVTVDLKSDN